MTTVDLITCQEGENKLAHGDTTGDAVTHYFGCLRYDERESFLNSLSGQDEKVKRKIQAEEIRIERLRGIFDAEREITASGKLLRQIKVMRNTWRRNLTANGAPSNPHNTENSGLFTQLSKNREKQFILEDTNANVIYFKKKEKEDHLAPCDHPRFLPSTFPDQKIPLGRLLEDNLDTNPLMWPCEKDMIRYFHIPANNMEWIEVIDPFHL